MPPTNPRPTFVPESYKSREDKIKCCDSDSRAQRRKLKARIFSSLALALNVYATENNSGWSLASGARRACARLRSVLSGAVAHEDPPQPEWPAPRDSTLLDAVGSWYPFLVTKYIRDCQRVAEDSPCRRMMTRISEARIFFADQRAASNRHAFVASSREELVNVVCVASKLKKYLKKQCHKPSVQPVREDSRLPSPGRSIGLQVSASHRDVGVQCPPLGESLRLSPELRFCSRSSLLLAERPRGALGSPSLEYVASYRPECRGLRSISSSAIFGLRNGDAEHRTAGPTARRVLRGWANRAPRKSKSKKPVHAILDETPQRAESEILRFSNFIQEDLSGFPASGPKSQSRRGPARDHIDAVKKILLEDYITEVREIVRAEPSVESRILERVKRRMDEDLAELGSSLSLRTEDSWPSRSSYVTASGCCSCTRCIPAAPSARPLCKACSSDGRLGCLRRRVQPLKKCASCIEDETRHLGRRGAEPEWSSAGQSSRSVDSGVLVDWPGGQSGDWRSSSGSSRAGTTGEEELVCRRVESAVRKFTERLILWERRARDRSSSRRRRRSSKPRTDRSTYNFSNYLRNSRFSSEEHIDEISTPSLVSLSDTETIPSPKLPT